MLKLLTTIVTQIFKVLGVGPKLPKPVPHTPQTYKRGFSLEVVRPDDLLVVTLDFYNLGINTASGSPRVERLEFGDGFIIAIFPPQSFAEQAFLENADGAPPELVEDPLTAPPVISRIAGPSQLVFSINDSLLPLDFKLDAILSALSQSEPIVQPTIKEPAGRPAESGDHPAFFFTDTRNTQFSAIEAPYRLFLSPSADGTWEHATAPAKSKDGKRTELWHTRLTRLTGDALTVSAVWSPDYNSEAPLPVDTNPFRMSLHAENRHEIVRSTADPTLDGAKPANVDRLMLSSQGAWLDLHGEWDTGLTGLGLVEWRHLMTAGRDHYVKVVNEGSLFHFGHRAVFIKITERKFQQAEQGPLGAYLRQRYFIIVREPTKTYDHPHVPFRTVTIKTLVTPNLDSPANHTIFGMKESGFWPCVGEKDFEFHIVATDWEGREIEFHTPLAFIGAGVDQGIVFKTVEAYNFQGLEENPIDEGKEQPHRKRNMGGQKIAFAKSKDSGDTTLETESMVFNALHADVSPYYLPRMERARVDIPAVRQISGNSSLSTIAFPKSYYDNATGDYLGNPGEVFAHLVDEKTKVEFTADKTGGMVAPNFDISGLSRAFGPVGGDIDKFAGGVELPNGELAGGEFHPKEVFPDITLLGGIPLSSILPDLIGCTPETAGIKIPQLKTIRTTAMFDDGEKEVIQTSYQWELNGPELIDTDIFKKSPETKFYISSIVNARLDGLAPAVEVKGGLINFGVVLLPVPPANLVVLNFDSVEFTAKPNAKVDFSVQFAGFEFTGLLAFVNALKDVIPMDGFKDPPFLDLVLDPPGVRVGFTQGIPTVGIGIFTLQNISLSASFYLPFIGGSASLRLEFCKREQPFILTVSGLGGGGFFAIDIGFNGVQLIEAALEFGAAIALDLGVASGAACVMAGIYYQRRDPGGFAIAAYLRAAGSLSVLGIITVSVELYIALNYESDKLAPHGGKLWGQAKLSVKVKIAFFSKSVSISMEREFGGSDPKFIDTVKLNHWETYCAAFAKV